MLFALPCLVLVRVPPPSIVHTTLGPVQGYTETAKSGNKVHVFRGVPFAATTGGDNRWMPPQPRKPWTSVLNATVNGPGCQQPHHNADVPCGGKQGPQCQSEDCLHLNIYCPVGASSAPTLFWIYGGAFNEGMNWGPVGLYDGTELADRGGICICAPNYRLGVLGFLVIGETKGNQAILDQRAAMQFVQRNIAAFGGDPMKVTLMGQSAGAMSAAVHLASPKSAGLFRAAILHSNVAAFTFEHASRQELSFGAKFAEMAGCGSLRNLTCLRAIPAEEIIQHGEHATGDVVTNLIDRILEGGHVLDAFAMQWSPVVDGGVLGGGELPDQPLHLFSKGSFNAVPLLLGTVQDEGATFIYDGVDLPLPEGLLFEPLMYAIFTDDAEKVVNFYSGVEPRWKDARDSLSYVLTDYWFKCSNARLGLSSVAAGQPTWMFRFDHMYSAGLRRIFPHFNLPKVCESRTCHASDLPFVFANYANYTPSAAELLMSLRMQTYWTNFVTHLDVNGARAAAGGVGAERDSAHSGHAQAGPSWWPQFNASHRLNMRIGTPDLVVESTLTGQSSPTPRPTGAHGPNGVCGFFDKRVGYDH